MLCAGAQLPGTLAVPDRYPIATIFTDLENVAPGNTLTGGKLQHRVLLSRFSWSQYGRVRQPAE
jgi:hypothetical protein